MSEKRAISFDERAMSVFMWIDGLAYAEGGYIDQICITRGAMARRYGLSRHHATRLLKRMVSEGMLIESFDPDRPGSQYTYWLTPETCEALASPAQVSWIGE